MTAHAVTDEQLGHFFRRVMDFMRRVREGAIPFDIAMSLLQRAIEVRPRTDGGETHTEEDVLLTQELLDIPVVIRGAVYHRHPNGGGLVAERAKVAETAYVSFFALVHGPAWVKDEARVADSAQFGPHATLTDRASVRGHARVVNGVRIADEAMVLGAGILIGNSRISGTARLDLGGNVGNVHRDVHLDGS